MARLQYSYRLVSASNLPFSMPASSFGQAHSMQSSCKPLHMDIGQDRARHGLILVSSREWEFRRAACLHRFSSLNMPLGVVAFPSSPLRLRRQVQRQSLRLVTEKLMKRAQYIHPDDLSHLPACVTSTRMPSAVPWAQRASKSLPLFLFSFLRSTVSLYCSLLCFLFCSIDLASWTTATSRAVLRSQKPAAMTSATI